MNKALHSISAFPSLVCKVLLQGLLLVAVTNLSAQFTVDVTGVDPTCPGYTNGSATATATGGWPPYTYTWSTGVSGPVLLGVGAGTYSVTVVDADMAIAIGTVTLMNPPDMILDIISTGDICVNPGDVEVNVTGGTPPYSYMWSNGGTSPVQMGLPAGLHCVTVTDANQCGKVACVTVTGTLSVDVETVDSQCAMLCDGSARADAMGGTPPYTYLWSTGATTQLIAPLGPGTYTVTVTDANGCTAVGSGVVSEPPPIIISLDIVHPGCQGATGSITASASGGVPGYTFLWSTGTVGPVLPNATAGTYTLVVTDFNNCSVDTMVTLVLQGLDLTVTATDETCPGTADGEATATASGGTPPYSYVWSNSQTGPTATGLTAGTYFVTVTDSLGCTASASVQINSQSDISIQINKTDLECAGDNDGSATATASGGTPPYSYQWSNGQSGPTITGLSAGTYSVTVTDSDGCTASDTTEILAPDSLELVINQTDINCFGDDDGSASAAASGGTPPYNYSWSNGQSGPSITGLAPGTYTVTVTDANGCTATASVTIVEPGQLTCQITIIQQVSAPGANDGVLEVSVTGGSSPFTYVWSNSQTGSTISGLPAGTYSVTVTDANGCTTTCSATLEEPMNVLGKLGDYVWEDVDRDGIQDAGEPPIRNVKVTLAGTDSGGNPVNGMTFTDVNGMYMFNDLPAGTYKLTFGTPTNFSVTLQNAGSDDAVDSDINSMGMTANVTLGAGDTILTIDAGFYDLCVNVTDAGTIGYDEEFCGPGHDPAPIVELVPPSGGTGPLEYAWMKSTISPIFSESIFQLIPGATGPTYDPPVIYQTTYYVRCVRRANCDEFLETNPVTKAIGDDAMAVIEGPNIVCIDQIYGFGAADAGPGATYSWDFGPNSTPRTATTRFVNVSWSNFGQRTVKLTVNANGCTASNIKNIVITFDPGICAPNITLRTTVVNDENKIIVEWKTPPEFDIYTYELQKSSDNENFKKLTEIDGVGNRFDMNYYLFTDENPKTGYNFYRVVRKTVSDGLLFYSETAEAMLAGDADIMIYPNPIDTRFTIERINEKISEATYEIYSAQGQFIQSGVLGEDIPRVELSLENYPAGIYMIRVVSDEVTSKSYRIVVE